MFLKIFNTIIYEANIDLESCKRNQYLHEQLTDYEISIVVPLIHGLLSSRDFDEFLDRSFKSIEYLQGKLPLTNDDVIALKKEFSLFNRYALTFFIVSDYLEAVRERERFCGQQK